MGTATYGTNAVDWETRIDFDRLREQRLQRLRAQLEKSELGALLAFDFANIRYMSSTHIGTWAMDKLIRFALVTRTTDPIVWDFGSAAKHHQLYNPWLVRDRDGARRRSARPASRGDGARAPKAAHGRASRPCVEPSTRTPGSPTGWRPRSAASSTGPAWPTRRWAWTSSRCRCWPRCSGPVSPSSTASRSSSTPAGSSCPDEISLLTQAASMVDAAYEDLYEFLRPGVKENECVGLVSKKLYDLGSEYVEGVNAISGERCSPHPHVYSDRLIRPGDPGVLRHPAQLPGLPDLLLPHVRGGLGQSPPSATPTSGPVSTWTGRSPWSVPAPPPPTSSSVWPTAQEFGFPDEEAAFALQYGHGVGLSIWEKPIFSRLVSLDHPEVLEEGMVFALETYWPSKDGIGAARIEEEVVVTATGAQVITKFPAEDLLVAGRRYFTVGGAAAEAAGLAVPPEHCRRARRGHGHQRRRHRRTLPMTTAALDRCDVRVTKICLVGLIGSHARCARRRPGRPVRPLRSIRPSGSVEQGQGADVGDFDGMVIAVTGAAQGQGAAEVRELASRGAAVVILDVRDEAGEALAAELDRGRRSTAEFRHLDVTDEARLGRTGRTHLRRALRPARRAGQQRRRGLPLRTDGDHRGGLLPGAGRQPGGPVPGYEGARPPDPRQRWWRDRQHRLRSRDDRSLLGRVLQQQVGPARPHEGRRHGVRSLEDPGERGSPGDRQHRPGAGRHPVPGRDAGPHADRLGFRAGRGRGRGGLPLQSRGRLHHRRRHPRRRRPRRPRALLLRHEGLPQHRADRARRGRRTRPVAIDCRTCFRYPVPSGTTHSTESPTMYVSRRKFFQASALGSAGLALAACGKRDDPDRGDHLELRRRAAA